MMLTSRPLFDAFVFVVFFLIFVDFSYTWHYEYDWIITIIFIGSILSRPKERPLLKLAFFCCQVGLDRDFPVEKRHLTTQDKRAYNESCTLRVMHLPVYVFNVCNYVCMRAWFCMYMILYCMVWYDIELYGTVRYATLRYATVRYGTVRYGMAWYECMIMLLFAYVCMYVCMYVRTYIGRYVCIYVYTYASYHNQAPRRRTNCAPPQRCKLDPSAACERHPKVDGTSPRASGPNQGCRDCGPWVPKVWDTMAFRAFLEALGHDFTYCCGLLLRS